MTRREAGLYLWRVVDIDEDFLNIVPTVNVKTVGLFALVHRKDIEFPEPAESELEWLNVVDSHCYLSAGRNVSELNPQDICVILIEFRVDHRSALVGCFKVLAFSVAFILQNADQSFLPNFSLEPWDDLVCVGSEQILNVLVLRTLISEALDHLHMGQPKFYLNLIVGLY